MSEFAPPPFPGDAPGGDRQEALTPAHVEAILAEFRCWLAQAAAPPPEPGGAPQTEPIDLHTLLGQFVALRHEVNLQTRAARAQQEQSAEALGLLQSALEALQRRAVAAEQAEQLPQEEQLRPLLKTLVDLEDALSLARREMVRVQDTLDPALARLASAVESDSELSPPLPCPAAPRRSFWARLFGAKADQAAAQERASALQEQVARQQQQLAAARESQAETRQAAERVRQFVASVITGYTMSLQRIERALQQHGLEPIRCVGEPFDPEAMEAVEVVTESGRGATEVIQEVRRGYRWRGRVFRYAQVRVARP